MRMKPEELGRPSPAGAIGVVGEGQDREAVAPFHAEPNALLDVLDGGDRDNVRA